MSAINIAPKQIIINDASQIRFLRNAADGATFVENPTSVTWAAVDGFQLEGFLSKKLVSELNVINTSGQKRVLKDDAASSGVAEIAAYTFTAAGGAKKGDVYRVVTESLDLTPVEFQNNPLEKRYQLGVDCANAAAIVTELVKQINADTKAPVVATGGFNNVSPAVDDTSKIVLTSKVKGVTVKLFVGAYSSPDQTSYTVSLARVAVAGTVYTAEDVQATTVAAALPLNTYDYLKNIDWAKNLDFDRNVAWYPQKGASYVGYYFEVKSSAVGTAGGNDIPNQLENQSVTGFKVWINTALTSLAASFLEFADDVNGL